MSGRVISGDGETMYLTTRALVTEGSLAIVPRPESAEGRDGRWYSKYGLGQTAVQLPFFVAGHAAREGPGATDDRAARFAVGMANSAVTRRPGRAVLADPAGPGQRAGAGDRGHPGLRPGHPGLALRPVGLRRAPAGLQRAAGLLRLDPLAAPARPRLGHPGRPGGGAGPADQSRLRRAAAPPGGRYFLFALWQWRHAGPPGPPAGRSWRPERPSPSAPSRRRGSTWPASAA